MKKLTILILTVVMVMAFTMGTMAFLPEGDYSLEIGTSRVKINPEDLNKTIKETNTNTFEVAKANGYNVEPIEKMEEMSSYYINIMYTSEPDTSEDAPDYADVFKNKDLKAGWHFEKINTQVDGTIEGYDTTDSNYKNINESYNLSLNGIGTSVDISTKNKIGFGVSYAGGYYFGEMIHTVETENDTKTTKESLSGMGSSIEVSAVANLGEHKLYAKAGYRLFFISNYDLNGVQYTAGANIAF